MNAKIIVRQNLLILLSICCSCVPKISKAQSGWTEDECIQYAIGHNFRMRNKQLDTQVAMTDVVAAYGRFLPSVHTVGVLGKRFGRSIDPRTNQYTSDSFLESTVGLNISLPVFEGFTHVNRLQFYRLNKEISILEGKVEENRLAFEVLDAFYRYCFDKEIHSLAVERRKLSEYYCGRMFEYVNLGMRSQSDLQEVKARLQSDIYQETAKSNACRLSLLALKELMNMKDADTLSVVMEDEGIEPEMCPLSVNGLYAVSESVLPEFHMMKVKEKVSRKSLSIANGALYPSIRMEFNLHTGYYGGIAPFREQLNNNMSKYVGVSISLPLFNGLSRWGSIRKERLRLQQIRNENERQRLSLYKEIDNTCLSFSAAFQECRLAKEQYRADSITWKESEEKWKEGMISVFELLEKRNRYIRVKAEIVRTQLQYNLQKRLIRFYQKGTFL